jgi:hypothetical protein
MFSPVNKRSNLNAPHTKKSPNKTSRLETLKGHNSFKDINSPKKSPEKYSSDEPCTPKNKNLFGGGRRKKQGGVVGVTPIAVAGVTPLMVDVTAGSEEDLFDPLSPSPIANFHHHYKDKFFKLPENKAYQYSCDGEVTRSVAKTDSKSPHDRRYDKKKANVSDKHVTYSAEYLRPIEEFIYPSLRPSKEEFERQRLEAKNNFDFSLPDTAVALEFDLQWKIQESDSLVVKQDLSSTVLYKIGEKGETNLRTLITANCGKKLRIEEEKKLLEARPAQETGLQKVMRKGNIMGNLFSKAERSTSVPPPQCEKEDPDDPNSLVSFESRPHISTTVICADPYLFYCYDCASVVSACPSIHRSPHPFLHF